MKLKLCFHCDAIETPCRVQVTYVHFALPCSALYACVSTDRQQLIFLFSVDFLFYFIFILFILIWNKFYTLFGWSHLFVSAHIHPSIHMLIGIVQILNIHIFSICYYCFCYFVWCCWYLLLYGTFIWLFLSSHKNTLWTKIIFLLYVSVTTKLKLI